MEYTVAQFSWPQWEAKQADDRPAEVETEINKQRRKVQNRKNQRAHRLRLKDRDSGAVQEPRPFQVRRWRLDELDHCPRQKVSLASERAATTPFSPQTPHTYTGISPSTAKRTIVRPGSSPTAHIHPPPTSDPQPFTFPLSSDHLLHLIQYNVFRALVSNKRTLHILPPDSTICTITLPCRDDMTLYPDIPPSLVPTTLQQTHYHSTWINAIPFPRIRDNLIRCEGRFDPWELMEDLVGQIMSSTPAPWLRHTSVPTTVPDTRRHLTLSPGSDTDEVTTGRKGLIVWGEPHEMKSWEATPGFLAKWTWIVEGCEELVEISNYWRMKRGEEPMRLPPPLSHAAPSGVGDVKDVGVKEHYISNLDGV
ncbi:hypothetical protein PENSOL_c064G03543 [Penicillium solitum]|uniref:BZIP domain-containing protein n=1 Tax=Penicillium solitum TaxID=60172 RepID=A0A1V6QJB5_9EURO|nr:uncharacterized protein PENSOL_c064G03543 [Penicillium solitum]OQD89318.1 hypothetical protein PENSOL_c064G03543 [Penicillium solitum]